MFRLLCQPGGSLFGRLVPPTVFSRLGASLKRSERYLVTQHLIWHPLEHLLDFTPRHRPQKSGWNLPKRCELKNVCCRYIHLVTKALGLLKERFHYWRALLSPVQAHIGCPL